MQFLQLLKLFLLPLIVVGVLSALIPQIMKTDILVLQNNMGETSITELLQQILLLVAVVVFYVNAKLDKAGRAFWVLVAGFFGCMFLRELDHYMDAIVHGFWFYPTMALAIGTIFYSVKNGQNMVNTAVEFKKGNAYLFIFIGLVIVLIFSRVFGTGSLWEDLMADNYQHLYKTIIQESLELFGYLFIFIGSCQQALNLKGLKGKE
ncbi:MAG: hypothetical protein HWE10_02430 [Gammaproteobacteria bacterium]|nr:hypothetical protein [Gammaproteobacteria bacterium]